jgi:hypothetical protein
MNKLLMDIYILLFDKNMIKVYEPYILEVIDEENN